MFFDSLGQIYIFSAFIYAGIICGIIYKILTLLRKQKVIGVILDLCFCIVSTFAFLFCALITNFGQIRLFMLVGFLIGIFVGVCTLGKTVANFAILIYNKIRNMLKFLKQKYLNKGIKTNDGEQT
ncbi:MAG: spore cortex biosynthesis protein YabQ [Clostridia bacterium]|jgi:hypothetical protein|nr:spore cortex biosynthesis protein YabQ [Clostridia bacterium]